MYPSYKAVPVVPSPNNSEALPVVVVPNAISAVDELPCVPMDKLL
jgi:hypothetical protein